MQLHTPLLGCLGGAVVGRRRLVIERSVVRLPAGALSSQLGQLSLHSLRVPSCMAGVTWGVFTYVGWQVTLCDPIWQVTSRSSEVEFPPQKEIGLYQTFTFYSMD